MAVNSFEVRTPGEFERRIGEADVVVVSGMWHNDLLDRAQRWNRLFGLYIAGGWLLPGRKRVVPYSIQTLKRLRPALFRQDLIALLDLLNQQKIKPLLAQRFPFDEARQAHGLLGKGGVIGKIVLVRDGSSLESGAA